MIRIDFGATLWAKALVCEFLSFQSDFIGEFVYLYLHLDDSNNTINNNNIVMVFIINYASIHKHVEMLTIIKIK